MGNGDISLTLIKGSRLYLIDSYWMGKNSIETQYVL